MTPIAELGTRRTRVLKGIVEDFIARAEPVGSQRLLEILGLDVSPATVRNDMAHLEDVGYIAQPHTSAGRVPTDRGFRAYVDHLMVVRAAEADDRRALSAALEAAERQRRVEERLEELANALAKLTNTLAFAAMPTQRRTFVSGISHFLRQPEAVEDHAWAASLVETVEDGTTFAHYVCEQMTGNVTFVIGREHAAIPLRRTALVLTTHRDADGSTSVFGFLGPTRFPYEHHSRILRFLHDATA